MALRVRRLYQTAAESICVIVAVTHPPESIINFLHMFNLLKRIILLAVGIALLATTGTPCSPGVAIPQFSESEWGTVTYADWADSLLPGGQTIAMPGNNIWPGIWIMTVTVLIIYDTMRCALVASSRWNRHLNQIDMTWHIMTYIPIPLVFMGTALTLGHKDGLILVSIVVLVLFSGACGTVVEHVRAFINPHTIPGMPISVIAMLRVMQDLSLIIASQLVAMPLMSNIFNTTDEPTKTQLITFTLHTCLVLCLTIINHRNHRMCNILERTWPETPSTCEWTPTPITQFVEKTSRSSDYHLTHHKKSDHIDDNAPCGGVHEFQYEPNTDVVRVVEGDKRVTTIKLTEEFHNINRIGLARTGMYVSRIGVNSPKLRPQSETVSEYVGPYVGEEHRQHMRHTAGTVLEWRRYYLVNIVINSLLLANIISITGISEGSCSFKYPM